MFVLYYKIPKVNLTWPEKGLSFTLLCMLWVRLVFVVISRKAQCSSLEGQWMAAFMGSTGDEAAS